MKALKKKYRQGGEIDFRTEKEKKQDARAERKQERKDEKGMIPAKYRNRGEAGLQRYRDDMAKKRSKKNAKGLAKVFGTKAARKKAAASRKAANQTKRRMRRQSGAGCQGAGCGAYE